MHEKKSSANIGRSHHLNYGFSLIELLIVVAVILVIAAIAIPNYMRSKMRANEASAVQSLRNISTAEVIYVITYNNGYTDNLLKLSGNGITVDQNSAGLIDQTLAAGNKSGYNFTFTVLTTDPAGHPSDFSVTADPQTPSTGQRHFYVDHTAVIRFNYTTTAGPTDGPIT